MQFVALGAVVAAAEGVFVYYDELSIKVVGSFRIDPCALSFCEHFNLKNTCSADHAMWFISIVARTDELARRNVRLNSLA